LPGIIEIVGGFMGKSKPVVDVVAFVIETPNIREGIFEAPSKLQIFRQIRSELRNYPNRPVIFVFPEMVFGNKEMPRSRSKAFVSQINGLLAQHGNAFVFMSMIERTPRAYSNTGYIITPSRKKKWFAYPKLTMVNENLINLQNKGALRSGALKARVNDDALVLVDKWLKRAKRIKGFPQIRIGGRDIQLRICTDLELLKHSPRHTINESKRKADLIIVPASGFGVKRDIREDEKFFKTGLKKRGAVLVVDEAAGRVSHYKRPRGSPGRELRGFNFTTRKYDPWMSPPRIARRSRTRHI
jgi:hypothetical protein